MLPLKLLGRYIKCVGGGREGGRNDRAEQICRPWAPSCHQMLWTLGSPTTAASSGHVEPSVPTPGSPWEIMGGSFGAGHPGYWLLTCNQEGPRPAWSRDSGPGRPVHFRGEGGAVRGGPWARARSGGWGVEAE